MSRSRYDGLVLEGRWQFVKWNINGGITLENIYNHNTIILTNRQFDAVLNGNDTIGHIISRRIGSNNGKSIFQNNTITLNKKIKQKYAQK